MLEMLYLVILPAIPINYKLSQGGSCNMNKSDLVDAIVVNAKVSKADAGKAVNALTTAITKALKNGDKVTVMGFGTFKVFKRDARTGRHPRTGKEIRIGARKALGFSAGKALKDALN